jgi:DNA polymerase-3 subunit chi
VLPLIARAAKRSGQRMLVVAEDADLLDRLDKALWEQFPEDFLAHGRADAAHAARQPVLLSADCAAANGATLVALADGQWRPEAEGFDRALLFFDEASRAASREVWRLFDQREDVTREFHELEGGKWVQKA